MLSRHFFDLGCPILETGAFVAYDKTDKGLMVQRKYKMGTRNAMMGAVLYSV